jgi:hypothetical protein
VPLSEEEATAIVNEARQRGIVVSPDLDNLAAAGVIVEQAREAYEDGVRGQAVEVILRLAGEALPLAAKGPVRELIEVGGEHFPVPTELDGDRPEMPRDLTTVSDRECRRLHSQFNAWLARTTFLVGVARSDLAAAEHMLEAARRRVLKAVPKRDDQGKTRTAQLINVDVDTHPEVVEWEAALAQHKRDLVILYALKDVYAGNVERLSRDWKMRSDEHAWERNG